uniref:R3H domain-containing protein n=1 Tax=Astyanax mexicanus TaxID=7994 RepID=A0A8B9KYT2_ASTMX
MELVCLLFQYLWDELVKRVFYLINCLCFSFSSVLLFPPLPNRLRFLIHQAAEKHPNLSTFSVGEDWSRRVVVCHAHLRLMPKLDSSDTDSSLYEHPYGSDRRTQGRSGGRAGHRYNHSRGNRRPDKAIYVPRALRQKLSESSDGSNGPRGSRFEPPLMQLDHQLPVLRGSTIGLAPSGWVDGALSPSRLKVAPGGTRRL